MHIKIEPSNGVPIYLQIMEEIKILLAAGTMLPGDKLPSVRTLAIELRVNPNTVSKAYNELERDGIIHTKRGEGTFVSERRDDILEQSRLDMIEKKADELVEIAVKFGIESDRVVNVVKTSYSRISGKEEV